MPAVITVGMLIQTHVLEILPDAAVKPLSANSTLPKGKRSCARAPDVDL